MTCNLLENLFNAGSPDQSPMRVAGRLSTSDAKHLHVILSEAEGSASCSRPTSQGLGTTPCHPDRAKDPRCGTPITGRGSFGFAQDDNMW